MNKIIINYVLVLNEDSICVLLIQKEIYMLIINHWQSDVICRYPVVFIDHCMQTIVNLLW